MNQRIDNSALIPQQLVRVVALCAMLFALCQPADAQQTGKTARIGVLDPSTASGSAVLMEAFRQELGKLGWFAGKNLTPECAGASRQSNSVRSEGTTAT